MSIDSKAYLDLLDLINKQEKVIAKQNDTIVKLVNENIEKENLVNELMKKDFKW